MERNYLSQAGWLVMLLLLGAGLLYWIPPLSLGKLKLRKMDVLSDVRPSEINQNKPLANDSVSIQKKKQAAKAPIKKKPSACAPNITCLEDFSNGENMKWFLQALRDAKSQPARVAFFGDSFIEGDLLTMSFRDTLQSLFGGRGVGFVPITSEVAQFRTTIQHQFENWETYSIVSTQSKLYPLGISGHCFVPLEGNFVEFRPGKKWATDFSTIKLFYENPSKAAVQLTINEAAPDSIRLESSSEIQALTLQKPETKSVRLSFIDTDSLKLYGASFESSSGVLVDNFSMRGNSGVGLAMITDRNLSRFNELLKYKLIVLQYGLNVVNLNDSTNFVGYEYAMVRVINKLKNVFPESSFLLIGVSDRASNQNGKFATYPDIPLMRDTQRRIAQKTHITFWDTYEAMGGENSMVRYVEANPTLAAKDYTHLTYRGGKKIAIKLANAILHERNSYAQKNSRP